MNRRSFIKALGVLAATPALAKYLNVFKSAPIREGIAKGTSMGMDFFNSVISGNSKFIMVLYFLGDGIGIFDGRILGAGNASLG